MASSSSLFSLPFSLSSLRSHSIFIPPRGSSVDDDWEVVDSPRRPSIAPSNNSGVGAEVEAPSQRIAMRDKDLIVAFGDEVRMTCLSGEGWEVKGSLVGSYRTLKAPHITFEVKQLVVNPSGRLLAVVGDRQLCVVLLPRTGTSSGDVSVRSFAVDEFNLSPSSTASISKVLWHPLGENGNSLWVLTSDGKLSEYDILRPSDPTQSFDFLPNKTKPSSSRFTAVDPLSQHASSFAFGTTSFPEGTSSSDLSASTSKPSASSSSTLDFSALTVYVLMANGDVYSMSPILPFHSQLSIRHLQSLRARCTARQRRLEADVELGQDGSAEHAAQAGRVAMQAQWLEAVVRQVKSKMDSASTATPTTLSTPTRGYGLRGSVRGKEKEKEVEEPEALAEGLAGDGRIKVHPPHLTETGGPAPGVHRPVLRQGPALFDPAPIEVAEDDDEEEHAAATDLLPIHYDGLTVLIVAWATRRVDVLLDLDGVDPRWVSSRDPSPPTWVLSAVESIILDHPQNRNGVDAVQADAPVLVADPIHEGVFYVQQGDAVDAVSIVPVLEGLVAGGAEQTSQITRLVESSSSNQLSIVGAVTFCNISLGYGLLALASTGQLASVEFDFRVGSSTNGPSSSSDPPAIAPSTSPSVPTASVDEHSLLSKPINFDSILGSIHNPSSSEIINKVRRLPDARQPLKAITPAHLRVVAEAASAVRGRIETLRHASETVERRVDAQVAEAQRQAKTLRDAQTRLAQLRRDAGSEAGGSGGSGARVEVLANRHEEMGRRLDKVLSAMMAEYRPQIGEVERKWFDELERLRQRVNGMKRGGQGVGGLNHRAQVLKEQLAVVKPLAEKAQEDPETEMGSSSYGQRQLRPLQAALSTRSDELARMMRKMESLSVKVDAAE